MSGRLTDGSPRKLFAEHFATELRKAMKARNVGRRRVAVLLGLQPQASSIMNWKSGFTLPRLDSAIRLAELLEWPLLASIVREARTRTCARQNCEATFFNETGHDNKRYCSNECRILQNKIDLAHGDVRQRARIAEDVAKDLEGELRGFREAVKGMCKSCEPEGYCRTPECPLRSVSPLPLARRALDAPVATPAEGSWGPGNREQTLEKLRESQRERWGRPGERERHAESMRQRHANYTPEEKARIAGNISKAKKEKAA